MEAWSHYEKFIDKYVGVGCHETFVDYRLFMAECNKRLTGIVLLGMISNTGLN